MILLNRNELIPLIVGPICFDETKNFFGRVFLEMRLRKHVRACQFIDLAELEKLSAERVRYHNKTA